MKKFIGHYEVIRQIAKGGMGEVNLAFDPKAERVIALKQIREDLRDKEIFKNRFLREAKLTANLTHPGIISIFAIHEEGENLYYTMPYVEGVTLKELLKSDKHPTIPSLLPIFKSIAQTVAYAHSKAIIHRDIKPENILLGNFGEVILLDWGLAQMKGEKDFEDIKVREEIDLTNPGKIVGTLAYMAPERALGKEATVQSDIYALGVILYQMLTLRLPFIRHSLKEFRKNHELEKLIDPEEKAPYRDVPIRLNMIVKKCLEPIPEARYQTTEELLEDLLSHMEGRSEWMEVAKLNIWKKSDWEFHENVLISKHIALSRTVISSDWVSMMVSKSSFPGNTRVELKIKVGSDGAGVGILLSIPEAGERQNPMEGYCLWLGTEEEGFSLLFRNTVIVMQIPDFILQKNKWHNLVIEKIENNLHFTLDGGLRNSYISYLPLVGTHLGLLSQDDDFEMEDITVSIGSQNLNVSCLAIPDAFLACKDYKRALTEYRRIGYSFPGHAEGREALFRAGITLLEEARNTKGEKKASRLYLDAIEEFSKLHHNPGAPLEYLGKALVYQACKDSDEEIKCLELGLRRYQKHPLASLIKEQILYRMHESAQSERKVAYQLILLMLRHLPLDASTKDSEKLFNHLKAGWEELPFFEYSDEKESQKEQFTITLAFWVANPFVLLEIFEEHLSKDSYDPPLIGNLLFALFEMGAHSLAQSLIQKLKERTKTSDLQHVLALLEPLILKEKSVEKAFEMFFQLVKTEVGVREFRTFFALLEKALEKDEELIEKYSLKIFAFPINREERIIIDSFRIMALLKKDKVMEAGFIFDTYSMELLNQETTLLHPLFGCFLYLTEGPEIASIHFGGVIDTPYPRSFALLGHELSNNILQSSWIENAFLFEKRTLYRLLAIYSHCIGDKKAQKNFEKLEKEQEFDNY